ncbi:hypothetical protein SETIT_3G317600v2 [Setaria italica]|uniref:AAA+ ATPase domain-containing protein n=1 Tax=Setaria italica TaxID=4555 RepID=K3Z3L6_SETIT|nr:putative disease resistance RPP13-like protein 3 [Setaria italica]XP_022681319.1 putative disease resistance RPP13-like protein 3 [Setaria italica]RCV18634.1 hypothetical protein SETIT_3G317600v2 [Setaria italica]
MVDPTVSISAGVMNSLLSKLTKLLSDEYKLLKSVRKEVKFLKDELSSMNALIQKLEDMEELDVQAREWRDKVRELAYDFEDCIDVFMHNLGGEGEKAGLVGKSERWIKKLQLRRHLASQIQELKARVVEEAERQRRYKVSECVSSSRAVDIDYRLASLYAEADKLVGIDGPREEIAQRLLEGENGSSQQLKLVSIVGPGGIGKTTLATQVYNRIRNKFDCTAFVSVSQNLDTLKILKEILLGIGYCSNRMLDHEQQVIDVIRQYLADKRYLFIIDDIRSIKAWDIIKYALVQNNKSSRVITTTQIQDVATTCCLHCDGQVYMMQPLDESDSRRLFLKRVFDSEDNCPEQYRMITENMLHKCKGVPLAITSIATLLASQGMNVEKWENMHNSFYSELETNPALEWMRYVPSLSYNDLSHELKTCLLYLGIYPEDYPIKKVDLVRRWVAEGFVSEKHGLDLEEVAGSYFDELINRSMIQPGKIIRGEMHYCRVHDLMLDHIISKCTVENFFTIIDRKYKMKQTLFPVRRLCCHFSNGNIALESLRLKKVRSFTTFPASDCMQPPISKFELLRVLNLQTNPSPDSQCLDLSAISNLFLLRYLRARGFRNLKLPEKIGKLQNLMTLDLGDSEVVCAIPLDVTSLSSLRHLTVPRGAVLPDGIGKLITLRTLEEFDLGKNSMQNIKYLGELTNLMELQLRHEDSGIFQPLTHMERRKYEVLAVSLCKIGNSNLRSLVAHPGVSLGCVLNCSLTHPRCLRRLHLDSCCPTFPKWMAQAVRLTSLILEVEELCSEDVHVLAGLPCLTYLDLGAAKAPNRSIMIQINSNEFSCLKEFKFKYHILLLSFEPGAMPTLQSLDLTFSGGSVIGIEHLASLEEISVYLKALPCDLSKIRSEISDALDRHPRNHTVRRRRFIFTPCLDDRDCSGSFQDLVED